MVLLDSQVYLFFLAIRGRIVEGAFCKGKVEYFLENFLDNKHNKQNAMQMLV